MTLDSKKKELEELQKKITDLKYNTGNAFEEKDLIEIYNRELLPKAASYFEVKYKDKTDIHYDYMIISQGISAGPTIMSFLAVKPKKVLIIHTDETEKNLKIFEEITGAGSDVIDKCRVKKENVAYIYEGIYRWFDQNQKPKSICVDFTGGTKAMSAGCAMAASIIGAQLIYISSKQQSDFKWPEPGSETLELVKDPYSVFGVMEYKSAVDLFNQFEYNSAASMFMELEGKNGISAKRELYSILANVSEAYSHWDSFMFNEACAYMEKAVSIINERWETFGDCSIDDESRNILNKQLEILQLLKSDNNVKGDKSLISASKIEAAVLSLTANSERKARLGKYELASLFAYRTIEFITQYKLTKYGLDSEEPDYKNLPGLKDKYASIESKLYHPPKGLPPRNLGLMNSMIVLSALEDPALKNVGFLRKVKDKTSNRNKSFLIHGYNTVNEQDFNDFYTSVVNPIVEKFISQDLEKDDHEQSGIADKKKEYRFISLLDK